MKDVEQLEKKLGLEFPDRAILTQALVHVSYLNENPDYALGDNERLEFLGDAVLGMVSAEYLYQQFPKFSEGDLTNMRASLVRRDTLASWASSISLGEYLIMGKGDEESGGRQRKRTLAGAFEALVAAIYLSLGFDAARNFILRFLIPAAEKVIAGGMKKDFKTRLQETAHQRFKLTPKYRTVALPVTTGDDLFTVEVIIGEEIMGTGRGRTKRAAQQDAAHKALDYLAPINERVTESLE